MSLIILINTNYGKSKIQNFIERTLLKETDIDIRIDGLDISFPIKLSVTNISVSEKNTDSIIIKNLNIDISPSIFSFWEIIISSIKADEISLLSIPKVTTKSNKTESGGSFFNPDVIIKLIDIENFTLGKEISGEEISLKLNSFIKYTSQLKNVSFHTSTTLTSSQKDLLGDNNLKINGIYNIKKNLLNLKLIDFKSDIAEFNGNFLFNKSKNTTSGKLGYNANISGDSFKQSLKDIRAQASGEIKLSGSVASPNVFGSGDINIDLPKNDYLKLAPISWTTNLNISGQNIAGKINMNINEVNVDGDIGYKNKKLYVENLKALAPGFEKTANVTFDPVSKILIGEVSFIDKTFKETAKIFPFLQDGSADLKINYSSSDNKTQQVSAIGKIKRLSTKWGGVANMDINLNSPDLFNKKLNKSNIDLSYLKINNYLIKKLSLNAHSKNDATYLATSLQGNQPYNIDLTANSLFTTNNKKDLQFNINNLFGKINNFDIKNTKNIKLTIGDQLNFELDNLIVGNGFINAESKISNQNVKSKIGLHNIPIKLIPIHFKDILKDSLINGNINLSGTKINPKINSDIEIINITQVNSPQKLSTQIKIDVENRYTNIITDIKNKTQNLAKISAKLPSKFSLTPFIYEIKTNQNLKANLLLQKEFNILSMLPLPEGQELSGILGGKMSINGSFNTPNFTGKLYLYNGKYQYDQHGVELQNISSKITGVGHKILFNSISANDILQNKLIGSGHVSFDKDRSFNIKINTDKFNFINTHYVEGLSKGKLSLNGNKNSAKIVGDFILGPMDIKIPEHFQENIPELNIIEDENSKESSNKKDKSSYNIDLGIKVQTGKKVYVRGWGVETELVGNLDIKGNVTNPIIQGKLKSKRGQYREFGKRLKIKEGVLTFDGPISPSPYLNIVGVHIVGNNEIRLVLSGSILNPDISIESTPDMSQDQALSMLIFGEKPDELSTFQAIQLADGVRRLSGHGGGFDPLGVGRKLLGVDTIDFKSDSEDPEKSSIGVGKHFSDKIYFEVEKGRNEGSAKGKIEIQITPKISIENILEQEGNSSVGINWIFDY